MDNLLSRYITISLLFGNIQKQTVCSGDDFSGKLYLIYMQNITTQTNKQKVSHVWTLLVFSSWNRTWILLVIDVVTQGVDINNNVAKPSNINDQSPPLEEDFLLRWPWVLGIGGELSIPGEVGIGERLGGRLGGKFTVTFQQPEWAVSKGEWASASIHALREASGESSQSLTMTFKATRRNL